MICRSNICSDFVEQISCDVLSSPSCPLVMLQGSELHWLACSLYVACRSSVPTVGKGTSEGNYVSLTRILRCSEMRCASYSTVALIFGYFVSSQTLFFMEHITYSTTLYLLSNMYLTNCIRLT